MLIILMQRHREGRDQKSKPEESTQVDQGHIVRTLTNIAIMTTVIVNSKNKGT